MSVKRRNTISYDKAIALAIISAVSAILAAFSEASPTGTTTTDVILVGMLAAFVTWLGASAPWWALMIGSGIALLGALAGPLVWILIATAAFTGSAWIGWDRANQPLVRAIAAGMVVQVSLRLEWSQFFLASAIIAGAAMSLIAVTGYTRRRRYVRKRLAWGAIGVVAFIGIALAGLAYSGVQASSTARDGYNGLLTGLEFLQDGKTDEAIVALQQAADDLADAGETLDGPLTQMARLLPGVAQNRNIGVAVLTNAADTSDAAATTLQFVELDQLTVANGVIDIGALASLEAPLDQLETTINELSDTLGDADSEWLLPPLQSRLEDGIHRAEQAAHQAEVTAAAARIGPDLLGADEPRTYFVAFVNNAEARGTSGLMGNWSEVTIDNGRLTITANGRTADLQTDALSDLELNASNDYLERYGPQGAQINNGVDKKYWSNVTISPDMPSVGNAMAQMYEAVTGTPVDGVFVIDPAGIAGLLEITGPVELSDIGQRIDANNAQQFLTLDQYEFAESDREDLLAAVTEATILNVLTTALPPPQQMAPSLAPAVLNGHISAWAVDPAEQALFELIGMDGSLPRITTAATDGIAISSNNSGGNKIESFLERTIEYRAIANQQSGEVTSTLTISLTNNAPTSGYPDYVIGNLADLPIGTNRMLLDVYTRLAVDTVTLDGEALPPFTLDELGYHVHTSQFEIPSGETVVLEFELSGNIQRGGYELAYRPQPLPNPDKLTVEAKTTGGNTILNYEGTLERRSVISAEGVRAWR